MWDPVFGVFFWGKVLSTLGVWIHNVAAAVITYEITGQAYMVGLVSAVQFAPQLLLAPLSGMLTDRGNAKKQLLLGRLVTFIGSSGLAFWIWAVGGPGGLPGAGPVVGASLIVGLGFVIGGPAMQSVVPLLIRPGELPSAVALNNVPMVLARAGAPAVAAVVTAQFGAAAAFHIAALMTVLHAVALLALPLPRGAADGRGVDFSVRASVRYVRSQPALAALLIGTAAVGVGAEPSVTLAPPLADALGGGADLAGLLASAFGIGAAAGFVVFGLIRRLSGVPRLSAGGLLVMAIGLTTAAIGVVPAMAVIGMGVCGCGMTLALTSLTTQIQEQSPDVMRGRIMALWLVAFLGVRPFAAALNGVVADIVSVPASLCASTLLVVIAAWTCRPRVLRAVSSSERSQVP